MGHDHELEPTMELVLLCKKCKRAFRKDVSEFEEADEYCPHCDNHYVIEAKQPELKFQVVMQQERGHEHKMMKDEREKERAPTLQQEVTWEGTKEEDPISDSELDF